MESSRRRYARGPARLLAAASIVALSFFLISAHAVEPADVDGGTVDRADDGRALSAALSLERKVSVGREEAILDLQDLQGEPDLIAVSGSVSRFLAGLDGGFERTALQAHLAAEFGSATPEEPAEEANYLYIIDENGDVVVICLETFPLTVSGPTLAEPVVVRVEEQMSN